MIDLPDYLLLALAAALGGAINAVAGGGTLVTFPALYSVLAAEGFAGAAVMANATSTVALVPGSVASAWGYRRELSDAARWTWILAPPSLIGGLIGSLLLVTLREKVFQTLVPWLILTATLLLALQPAIARWTGIGRPHAAPSRGTVAIVAGFQLLVAIYGGYFGAGIGILMLSSLAFMGLADIHQMNALKTLLASLINGVSVLVFVSGAKVHWSAAGAMLVAAIVGGYAGARIARRLDKNLVRRLVVGLGWVLAAFYFYQEYAG